MAIKNKKTGAIVNSELDSFLNTAEDIFVEDDIIVKAVQDFLFKVKDNLVINKLYASGNLSQSIKALPITNKGSKKVVSIEAEDYYIDVEEGKSPKGFSKKERNKLQPKILEWIGYKPELQIIAKDKKGQKALSYAIATNILKKGTIKRFGYKGKPFITSEIPYLIERLNKLLEEKWL